VNFREQIKRYAPSIAKSAFIGARSRFAAPPLEEIKVHDYAALPDAGSEPRLNLVIPSVSANAAFGGVTTGIDVFLSLAAEAGFQLRILLDDFESERDRKAVDKRAAKLGLDSTRIEIVPRSREVPQVPVRARDLFLSYNWWLTLSLTGLVEQQAKIFDRPLLPLLPLIQEYEPAFYPFSSTHMMARLAFDSLWPTWGIFNSSLLYDYFISQKHSVDRAYILEPKLSDDLRQFLDAGTKKKRRILIYGRPTVQRNCFSLIEAGLAQWAATDPQARNWELLSAGVQHKPIPLANGQSLRSVGKLSMDDYGKMLQDTAIGVSLMSSPHPSYPPLEMAHFGIRTITNAFANKDLSQTHGNIVSLRDVRAPAIAQAIGNECRAFDANPAEGWNHCNPDSSFLKTGPFDFIETLARDMAAVVK